MRQTGEGATIPVRVGQVWLDNDPRVGHRPLKVLAVGSGRCMMLAVNTGKKVYISTRRLVHRPNSRKGYRLATPGVSS